MERKINTEIFCRYFFYGMDNQEEVIQRIIEDVAILQKSSLFQEESNLIDRDIKEKIKERKGEIDTFQNKINQEKEILKTLKNHQQIKVQKKKIYDLEIAFFYKMESIHNSIQKKPILFDKQLEEGAKLLVQFRRFVSSNDKPFNQQYVFNNFEEMKEAKQIIKKQLERMQSINTETYKFFYIDYAPMSGIFYKGEKPKQKQWISEVIEILKSLQVMEKENIFQYYSTFLDVKYARAVNRIQKDEVKSDEEKNEIKNVYRMFLKRKASFCCRYQACFKRKF